MSTLDRHIKAALLKQQQQHLYRRRQILESAQGTQVTLGGQHFLNFSSNDYLGLANHPEVINSLRKSASEFGVGSGASHLINGHSSLHHQLEEALAEFTGRPRALLFSTGYMANLGVIGALLNNNGVVLQDRLNHASLLDAAKLAGATLLRYQHASPASLTSQLSRTAESQQRKLIATDGVFSMDGDLAPLPELAVIAKQQDAWLMVDDAHGFGVLGKNGGGIAQHFAMGPDTLPVLMGTLGKSFGVFGAFVTGAEDLIEYLIQFCRTYTYTTALPPAVAAAALTSLAILQNESWRREKLTQNIKQFRQGAEQLGLALMSSQTPIQPVLLGDETTTLAVGKQLHSNGILVGTIRPPTVAKGSARLRITLCAEHSTEQIERLLNALDSAVNGQATGNLA